MTAFTSQRDAALALLNAAPLKSKEGGFLGQVAFSDDMSPKQRNWLVILLKRHGLPELSDGGTA